jgi:hypothetical protein
MKSSFCYSLLFFVILQSGQINAEYNEKINTVNICMRIIEIKNYDVAPLVLLVLKLLSDPTHKPLLLFTAVRSFSSLFLLLYSIDCYLTVFAIHTRSLLITHLSTIIWNPDIKRFLR